jgi:hypothetical protein
MEFDNQYFHQEKGLVIGTPCSPDIANLVLGNKEHYKKILFHKGTVLYVHYIDDMFTIVEADSEEDACLYCLDHIGWLNVQWEVSNTRIHFLDIEVFKLPGKMKLHYYPY